MCVTVDANTRTETVMAWIVDTSRVCIVRGEKRERDKVVYRGGTGWGGVIN